MSRFQRTPPKFRIVHDGGGFAREVTYRTTWEAAVTRAQAGLLPKWDTAHKRARIQSKGPDGEWTDTGWKQPTPPTPP